MGRHVPPCHKLVPCYSTLDTLAALQALHPSKPAPATTPITKVPVPPVLEPEAISAILPCGNRARA